jgi:hypothetical protein
VMNLPERAPVVGGLLNVDSGERCLVTEASVATEREGMQTALTIRDVLDRTKLPIYLLQ